MGKAYKAHRVAYYLHSGIDPADLLVCHECDNPPCTNPAHLFLGTDQDNIRDRNAKGRQARGDRSGARTMPEVYPRGTASYYAKLTEAQVNNLRLQYAIGGTSHRKLAKIYGISYAQVGYIIQRKKWAHVA